MMYFNGKPIGSANINGLVNIDQNYNPESENPQSGKAVAEALANIPSGSGGGSITVDDYLDAESTNPVQNKVVKAKIDDIEHNIATTHSTAAAAHQRIIKLETQVGDIDAALDTIIALQEEIIGGDGE